MGREFVALVVVADVQSWTALALSAVAVIASVLLGLRSTGIAQKALKISEAEYTQRERERQARASLQVAFEPMNMEQGTDGVLSTEGNRALVRLKITITNSGDRDSGRGDVEVSVPTAINDLGMRWSGPGGHELPDFPERAGRVGDRNVLPRRFGGIGAGYSEDMYVTMPTSVPDEGVGEYPVEVRARAEGAEPVTAMLPLRIQRKRF